MKSTHKIAFIYAIALVLSISLAIQFASAQTNEASSAGAAVLDEEELDRVLAPIALYPDTLLTHILVASTYPMDVLRAARWREKNADLDHEEVLERVEVFSWDPSVKALTPFTDVLTQMSDDLDWLNFLGDSVIADEEWVLSRIQMLRDQAYASGSLNDNEHLKVEREEDVIVIESVRDRVVYVPFYDTRVVYGNWWHARSPYYWHHPRHYSYHRGFYWSPSIHIASHFFFGGFNWHHGYVVINNNFHRSYRNNYHYGHKRVYSREFKRWRHNVNHRRARYNDRVVSYHAKRSGGHSKVVRNREVNKRYGEYQKATPIQVAKHNRTVTRNGKQYTQPVRQQTNRTVVKSTQLTQPVNKQTTRTVVKRDAVPKRQVTTQRTQPVNKQSSRTVVKRDVVTKPSSASQANRTVKRQISTERKQYTQPVRNQSTKTVTKQRTVERSTTRNVQKSSSRRSAPKQGSASRKVSRSSGGKQKQP